MGGIREARHKVQVRNSVPGALASRRHFLGALASRRLPRLPTLLAPYYEAAAYRMRQVVVREALVSRIETLVCHYQTRRRGLDLAPIREGGFRNGRPGFQSRCRTEPGPFRAPT